MSAVAELNTAQTQRRSDIHGRHDKHGQESVIEIGKLRERMENLLALYEVKTGASQAYSESVKAAAEASGLHSSTVRAYIAARANDQIDEKCGAAMQLALVFEEMASA